MPELTKSSSAVVLPYATLRNISSQQDTEQDRKVLSGQVPFTAILDIPTNQNVREYLVDAEGRKRRQLTQVHRAMLDTLAKSPEDFSVLNGGVVIVAEDSEHNQAKKHVTLYEPSIINGSQTQGVLRDFYEALVDEGEDVPEVYVKYEVIITESDDLVADTSIARNTQNNVMPISIAGQKGLLDDLEEALQGKDPALKLRKSETDWTRRLTAELEDESFVYTEKLIQVLTALVPAELWLKPTERDNPNKVYTYSQKTKCLRDYKQIAEKAKEGDSDGDEEHERAKRLHQFYLDIAGDALDLYDRWKSHQGFIGHRVHNLKRNDHGGIVEIPDGMIFPILSAYSAFVVETDGGWRIQPPSTFDEDELIEAAVTAYREVADSNFTKMGKSKACYSHLYQITKIYQRHAR